MCQGELFHSFLCFQAQQKWQDVAAYTRLELEVIGGDESIRRSGGGPMPRGSGSDPQRQDFACVRLLNDLGKCHLAADEPELAIACHTDQVAFSEENYIRACFEIPVHMYTSKA